jgi:hypothetical protein
VSIATVEKSFLSHVKLLPWAQLAFSFLAILGLIVFLLGGSHGIGPDLAKVLTIVIS